MGHQESYRHNEAYAEFLANWDANFYAKYTDFLRPSRPNGRVLDVGCGAGQVVGRLTEAGFEAYGVDVSEPNIANARRFSDRCRFYDGKHFRSPTVSSPASARSTSSSTSSNRRLSSPNWSG